MNKRALILLICAFVLTRGYGAWATGSTMAVTASGDMRLYESWADAVIEDGRGPYSEVDIEYPPGSLPFVLAPRAATEDYRAGFVGLMVIVDALGLAGSILMARRTGSLTGTWIWVWGVFFLGPVIYMRLDLVPAAATIWAIEASTRDSERLAGAWWGFATVAKLYPLVLLPAVVFCSRRPKWLLAIATATAALFIVPFTGSIGDLWSDVAGYHFDRGFEVESTWAVLLLAAGHAGHDTVLQFAHKAIEATSPIAGQMKLVALTVSILAAALGTLAIVRGDRRHLYAGLYGLMALVLGVGTVLSPQFIVWLVALAAAAGCMIDRTFRMPLLIVLPIAFATQMVFPVMWLSLTSGAVAPLLLVAARNLALISVGIWTLMKVASTRGASASRL